MIDSDGYLARLLSFATRPNAHGATKTVESVSAANDTLTITGHGYVAGQSVALTVTGGGAAPAGLTASVSLSFPLSRSNFTEYFVIVASVDTIKLATTHYNALAGNAIDLTSAGTATIQITALGGGAGWYLHDDFSRMSAKTFATTDVNTSTETITVTAHGFSRGHKISFSSSGTVPAGLTAGTAYFVIIVDANNFKVATSEVNAWAGTAINITSQGSGTHTVSVAEHFVVITDTLNPVVNAYNSSPAGCAPKFLKLGYHISDSGYVRQQCMLWWDKTTHMVRQYVSGHRMATYDSALFAYMFIGGDEFLFQSALLGSSWERMYIDTFIGLSSKLEPITKVGVLQSAITAGSDVVLTLAPGETANFTVDKFYYLYDFSTGSSVNYVKVKSINAGANQITIYTCSKNFEIGAVICSYAHRYYTFGAGAYSRPSYSHMEFISTINWGACIPYVSCYTNPTWGSFQHADTIYQYCAFIDYTMNNDAYLGIGDPDDEGYYDCMRFIIGEYNSFANNQTEQNRIYGKSSNTFKTARGTMGWMTNTRTLLGIEYLNYDNGSSAYTALIKYSESAS